MLYINSFFKLLLIPSTCKQFIHFLSCLSCLEPVTWPKTIGAQAELPSWNLKKNFKKLPWLCLILKLKGGIMTDVCVWLTTMLLRASLLRWHAARRKGKKYREGRRKGRKNKGRKMLKDKAPQALQELEAGNYRYGNWGGEVETRGTWPTHTGKTGCWCLHGMGIMLRLLVSFFFFFYVSFFLDFFFKAHSWLTMVSGGYEFQSWRLLSKEGRIGGGGALLICKFAKQI